MSRSQHVATASSSEAAVHGVGRWGGQRGAGAKRGGEKEGAGGVEGDSGDRNREDEMLEEKEEEHNSFVFRVWT